MQDEIYHFGIKGMKWGIRRYQNKDGTLTAAGKKRYDEDPTNDTNGSIKSNTPKKSNASKRINYKKAAKVGAAIVGTALATYGAYKVAKFVQGKRSEDAMKKASKYINDNFLNKVGESKFANGKTISNFENKKGTSMVIKGRGNKDIGKYNAGVVATGRKIYEDATNTKLDKGLSKVVGAGDAVGNAAKKAGSAAKNSVKTAGSTARKAATSAKNTVLDTVNPQYAYVPTDSGSTTRMINGMRVTTGYQHYKKRKVKR